MRYVLAIAMLVFPLTVRAQDPPAWKMAVKLSDGRTFLTDGSIILDAALAKPKAMPKQVLPEANGKLIEKYMAAPLEDEFGLGQLARKGSTYVAPSGVTLSAAYVDYLAGTLGRDVRFRMKGDLDPVVVLAGGKAVGVVMAMARAKN